MVFIIGSVSLVWIFLRYTPVSHGIWHTTNYSNSVNKWRDNNTRRIISKCRFKTRFASEFGLIFITWQTCNLDGQMVATQRQEIVVDGFESCYSSSLCVLYYLCCLPQPKKIIYTSNWRRHITYLAVSFHKFETETKYLFITTIEGSYSPETDTLEIKTEAFQNVSTCYYYCVINI